METSSSESSRYSECITRSAGQRSTMTACTDSQKKLMDQEKCNHNNDSEDINQQNLCNKRSEKLNKPCENGFCYCFTSDSDQHVRKKKPKMKSRKYSQGSSNSKFSEENTTETSDFSDRFITKEVRKNLMLPIVKSTESQEQNEYNAYSNRTSNQNYLLTARTSLDENKNAPLIHIVQEIHADGIISEVKINKPRMIDNRTSPKKVKKVVKAPLKEFEFFTEETLREMSCNSETEHQSYKSKEINEKLSPQKPNIKARQRHPKGGLLLKRRISNDVPSKPRLITTPPKKPPRCFSEKIEKRSAEIVRPVTNYKEAEVVLNKFFKQHGYNFEKSEKMKSRKSFPMDRKNGKHVQTESVKFVPSCPSFSELDDENDIGETKIGWVTEEVNKMLNYDKSEKTKKHFVSYKAEPRPQMGWVIPKQDIDTVDGLINKPSKVNVDKTDGLVKPLPPRESDIFHNFAKNMESKSTPIKSSEFISDEKPKQNDNLFGTPDNKNKTELSTNLSLKAKESTCDFIKNSAQKFANLVSKISKEKLQNKSFMKNVSCQTSNFNLNDTFGDFINDTSINKKARFSLQSPPGSYFSSSPKKNNDIKEFDFDRKVNSPRHERISQRRLSFSPKKLIKNFSYRPANTSFADAPKNSKFYKSYQSEIHGDFSLNLMNDILLNIKAKLEASDRHASNVFRDVKRNEKARRLSRSENIQNGSEEFSDISPCEVEANADVHNYRHNYPDEIYSEIEEEKIVFTGSPSIRSLNEISHFYANNDPNAEYAEVRKTCKSKLSNRESYNSDKANVNQQNVENYEPTYVEIEKNQINETNSYDSVDKIPSKLSPERNCSCICQTKSKTSSIELEDKKNDINEKNFFDVKNKKSDVLENISVGYKSIKEIYTNQLAGRESSVNLFANNNDQENRTDICIIVDETKTVKELVDYFETSRCPNNTCNQEHSVSYESPNDSSSIQYNEMSTTTFQELKVLTNDLQEDIYEEIPDKEERSKSCPLPENYKNLTRKCSIGNQTSLEYDVENVTVPKKKTMKYQLLKHQFRKSIKRGKTFFKKNLQNLSLNETINSNSSYDPWEQSNLGITSLFIENDDNSWQKHLEKAVFICRKLPVLESSIEAVEAERLLLYSKLKTDKLNTTSNISDLNVISTEKATIIDESSINIEEFVLPIQNDIEFSEFFNFFYVGVFSDGQRILSTNYAEKHDKLIVFRKCNIIFENVTQNTKIKCDIYVLRLRKILNTKMTKEQIKSKMEEINYFTDSNEQLFSRFKFQGSFQLFPQNFTPYTVGNADECIKKLKNQKFCLHSIKSVNIPTEINDTENSMLLNYVTIKANLEIVFKKFKLEGFLNVRSIELEHDWNKRWCKVENFNLYYWNYPQDCNHKKPNFSLNLLECINDKIEIAKQEICPRPKSFIIKLKNMNSTETSTNDRNVIDIYFSADNQNELNYWLIGLNKIIDFKRMWM